MNDARSGLAVDDYAVLDIRRRLRTGIPETVLAEHKTPQQTVRLLTELRENDPEVPALATRCGKDTFTAVQEAFGERVQIDEVARTALLGSAPTATGNVVVLTAGTTDLSAARECLVTAIALGVKTDLVVDVGVAGLERLLSQLDRVRRADCIVVAAGMDGALPSVVAGLVEVPVIGLPTSTGYGAAAGGGAALSSMVATCSPGVAVVNIDNGYGAAVVAAKMLARHVCATQGERTRE